MESKGKFSEETGKGIGEGVKGRTGLLVHDQIIREAEHRKDLKAFIYAIGIIGPLIAIFQAIKIFTEQSAAGVSAVYWVAYLSIAVIWFGYGAYNKLKPIMAVYGAWILIEIAILNGIYFYG